MNVETRQLSPVEYELEITATADDLAPKINEKLKAQRQHVSMKGFRPGKVPTSLVKKMYGQSIALDVVDHLVRDLYQEEVIDNPEYDVLGRPVIQELDYDPVAMGDMRAAIRFGVRGEIDVQDLSDITLERVKNELTDDDVAKEVEHMRLHESELKDVDGEATEERFVVVDVQTLDKESDTAIVGQKDEDVVLALNSNTLPEGLKSALLGKKAGDTVRVELPIEEDNDESETQAFEVTVKAVQERELPDMDEAFIKKVSKDQASTEEELHTQLRTQMDLDWEKRARELFERDVQDALLERHDVDLPGPFVETYLDSLVEEVQRQNDDKLPENFDMARFRESNRPDAERTLSWILLRDQIVKNNDIDVTDQDIDAHLAEIVGEDSEISTDVLRSYYEQSGILPQVEQRLLDQKVYDLLREQVTVNEVTWDAYKTRREAEEAAKAEAAAVDAEQTEEAPAEAESAE